MATGSIAVPPSSLGRTPRERNLRPVHSRPRTAARGRHSGPGRDFPRARGSGTLLAER